MSSINRTGSNNNYYRARHNTNAHNNSRSSNSNSQNSSLNFSGQQAGDTASFSTGNTSASNSDNQTSNRSAGKSRKRHSELLAKKQAKGQVGISNERALQLIAEHEAALASVTSNGQTYYIDGLGAYNYDELYARQESGEELNFSETRYLYLFRDIQVNSPQDMYNITGLSDAASTALLTQAGMALTIFEPEDDATIVDDFNPTASNWSPGVTEETVWEGDTMLSQVFYSDDYSAEEPLSDADADEASEEPVSKSSSKAGSQSSNQPLSKQRISKNPFSKA